MEGEVFTQDRGQIESGELSRLDGQRGLFGLVVRLGPRVEQDGAVHQCFIFNVADIVLAGGLYEFPRALAEQGSL